MAIPDRGSDFGPWQAVRPVELPDLLNGGGFRWWVSGGWAIELAVGTGGTPRRPHADIDVAVPRSDVPALRRHLAAYDLHLAHDGVLTPLAAADPVPGHNWQIWARRDPASPWMLDVQFTPVEGADWVYKRDPRVLRPLRRAIRVSPGGIPFLAPEIVLLFKAKYARDGAEEPGGRDAADAARALPLLTAEAAGWLAAALELTEPGHPWLTRIRRT